MCECVYVYAYHTHGTAAAAVCVFVCVPCSTHTHTHTHMGGGEERENGRRFDSGISHHCGPLFACARHFASALGNTLGTGERIQPH